MGEAGGRVTDELEKLRAELADCRKALAEVQAERDKWFECHAGAQRGMARMRKELGEALRTNRRLSEEKRKLRAKLGVSV